IRELENTIESAVVLAENDTICREELPFGVRSPGNSVRKDLTLKSIERSHIQNILNMLGGNKKKAAALLGLDASTLWRKLKRYQG
ncbi:MAG: helix-turn-helix domain-containing protein, partial [Nitrospirota bacterium]